MAFTIEPSVIQAAASVKGRIAMQFSAIGKLEHAGKHLVKTRGSDVYAAATSLTAVQAAHSTNPDVQALAVLSVLLARVTGGPHSGWVDRIVEQLNLPE